MIKKFIRVCNGICYNKQKHLESLSPIQGLYYIIDTLALPAVGESYLAMKCGHQQWRKNNDSYPQK